MTVILAVREHRLQGFGEILQRSSSLPDKFRQCHFYRATLLQSAVLASNNRVPFVLSVCLSGVNYSIRYARNRPFG